MHFTDNIQDEVEVLLTNTLYFKDAWTIPFDMLPKRFNRTFTLKNGSEVDTTGKVMVRDSDDFLLVTNLTLDGLDENFQFTVVAVPYGVRIDFGYAILILILFNMTKIIFS